MDFDEHVANVIAAMEERADLLGLGPREDAAACTWTSTCAPRTTRGRCCDGMMARSRHRLPRQSRANRPPRPGRRRRCCCSTTWAPSSGQKRTSPLAYIRDGDDVGDRRLEGRLSRRIPPGTTTSWRIPIQPFRSARSVSAGARSHGHALPSTRACGPRWSKTYSGFADYQERTERQIPLVILEPRAG